MTGELPRPQWLGRLGYRWALALQRARRNAIVAGLAPEAMWMLEHDPVVTVGRRHVAPHELPTDMDLVATERGGLATWHGPGQLVGYLLLDVASRGGTVKGTVRAVECGVIAWLRSIGIEATLRPRYAGVWVGDNKICAIGMHFRKGVSMHGFALNLTCDLVGFSRIVPCGILDCGVTSVRRELGGSPMPHEVADAVGRSVLSTFAATATLTPRGAAINEA